MKRLSLVRVCVLFFCFSLFFCGKAYAYLDPGTGSYFFQLIIAGLLAASFGLKIFWKRIEMFFKSVFSAKGKKEKNGSK